MRKYCKEKQTQSALETNAILKSRGLDQSEENRNTPEGLIFSACLNKWQLKEHDTFDFIMMEYCLKKQYKAYDELGGKKNKSPSGVKSSTSDSKGKLSTRPYKENTKPVPGKAASRYYDEGQKEWFDYPITVYVDGNENAYIFAGDDGVVGGGDIVEWGDVQKFIKALEKGLRWEKIAKKEKTDITKVIKDFSIDKFGTQWDIGVKLTFSSSGEGAQSDVILRIQNFKNNSISIDLHMNPEQVAQLIVLFKKIPDTITALKEEAKRAQEEKAKRLEEETKKSELFK